MHPPASVVPGGPCNPLPSLGMGLQHLPPLGCKIILLLPWQSPPAIPHEPGFFTALLLVRDGWFYILLHHIAQKNHLMVKLFTQPCRELHLNNNEAQLRAAGLILVHNDFFIKLCL